ncbi:MAG: hypothetical protein U9Q70_03955 [Chloroflexota bacterium]|nr:hypothetical protein [Chloroflexota bacterium]
MNPTYLIPHWLIEWSRIYAKPFLKVQLGVMFHAILHGVLDTILFISFPLALSVSSQSVWNQRYQFTAVQQERIMEWADISRLIAYQEDIPPIVPLVLWYKEGGLKTENPLNCEGIMGLYSAVQTGELPCFPAGAITSWELAYQLQLGARTFKEYCPTVSYTTTDPRLLKRCYLYYNAGPRTQTNPDSSAYVMNGYDSTHQDMLHVDVQGQEYRLKALGAWPTHLAIQAQLMQRGEPAPAKLVRAPLMLAREMLARAKTKISTVKINESGEARAADTCREPVVQECFVLPHPAGEPSLRPHTSPFLETPIQRSNITCDLLPGVDLLPAKTALILAPLPGELTRYTDQYGHLAIQIENEEWTVWLTGLRAYVAREGNIVTGTVIAAVGGEGNQVTLIHYTIYDKIQAGFVDPLSFLPEGSCPPVQ